MIGTTPVSKSVSEMSYVMFLALLNFEIIPPIYIVEPQLKHADQT